MGYVPDWQRQNMKKTGQSGPTTTNSRKDMGSLFHSSPANQHKSVSTPMRLADGDTEETYKARGQEASAGESVGFFERLRAGNIDQPGSEAYNRWGAGRAKADEAETARHASRAASAPAADRSSSDSEPVKAAEAPKYSGPEYKDTEFGDLEGAHRAAAARVSTSTASTPSRSASAPARRANSSVSGPVRAASTPDQSDAETNRLKRQNLEATPNESRAETSRLVRQNSTARMAAFRPAYETPFDRTNRESNEAAEARKSRQQRERETLQANIRNKTSGDIDPKTLLPKR